MPSYPKRLWQTQPPAARAAQAQRVPWFNSRSFGWMRLVTRQEIKEGCKGIHATQETAAWQALCSLRRANSQERGCTSLPALAELLLRLGAGPHLSALTSKGKSVASSSHRLSEEQGKFCRPTNLYCKSKTGLQEATGCSAGEQVAASSTGVQAAKKEGFLQCRKG